jgi:MoxR-like ATPase
MSVKFSTKEYLRSQGVSESLIAGLKEFRRINRLQESELDSEVLKGRIPLPQTPYIGGRVLTMAISALLEGKHIILEGEKSSGKNVLANMLAYMFQRPTWTSSCHVQVDESKLVGSETFRNNEVTFREGHVVRAMKNGGFFIADEVNFSRPEAVSVLYSATDFRGEVDISGYSKVIGHPAYRVIATMNYGYSGTRELNEAFADRFVVIHCGGMDEDELKDFLLKNYPTVNDYHLGIFAGVYMDLQKKAENSEISTRAVSLRGLLDALACMERGLKPLWALEIGLINKAFDPYERTVVSDTVKTRIPEKWEASEAFGGQAQENDREADFQ